MTEEQIPFALTIVVADHAQGQQVDAVVEQEVAALTEDFNVSRLSVQPKAAGGIGALYTVIGAATVGVGAVRQLSRFLNVLAVTVGDLPSDVLSIQVGDDLIPLHAVTDEMIESWLPPEPTMEPAS